MICYSWNSDPTVLNLRTTKLTELQDVSTSYVPISKGVCPQQAVGASLQNMSFVVWQILFKSTEWLIVIHAANIMLKT